MLFSQQTIEPVLLVIYHFRYPYTCFKVNREDVLQLDYSLG